MVTERMKSKAVSQMLWTAPIPEAVAVAQELKKTCSMVIALTHIGFKQDQLLAEATQDIDIILGGHSHTVLDQPLQIGSTWICQGGSHGRFYGKYQWQKSAGMISSELVPW